MTPSKSQARPTSDGAARKNGTQVPAPDADPTAASSLGGARKPAQGAGSAPKGEPGTTKGAKKVPAAKAPSRAAASGSRGAAVSQAETKAAPSRSQAETKAAPSRSKAAAKEPAVDAAVGTARNRAGTAPAKGAAPSKDAAPGTGAAGSQEEQPAARAVPAKPYADDTRFLQEQRELLETERSVYKGQAADLKAEADSLAEDREPGDVQFDEESGEGGTVTVDRERDLALSAQALAAVEEIDEALARIELGTYGACERCHQPIPKSRLRALPFARLCVACKSGGLSRR